MLSTEQIHTWISDGLGCELIEVEGDGHHFSALVVSSAFAGLSRIARQQLLNRILKTHFDSGTLHALSMQTLTPEEWRNRG